MPKNNIRRTTSKSRSDNGKLDELIAIVLQTQIQLGQRMDITQQELAQIRKDFQQDVVEMRKEYLELIHKLNEHTLILSEHTRVLNEHTQILNRILESQQETRKVIKGIRPEEKE
jgi:hypothetical protein